MPALVSRPPYCLLRFGFIAHGVQIKAVELVMGMFVLADEVADFMVSLVVFFKK